MITDEERREVARKLRAAAVYLPDDIDSEDLELALADECDEMRSDGRPIEPHDAYRIARRIREALGVSEISDMQSRRR